MAKALADSAFSLLERKIIVDSAGITAQANNKATLQAQETVKKRHWDLTSHLSKNITEVNTQFDYVICMELSIKEAVIAHHPSIGKNIINWHIQDPYKYRNSETAATVYEETLNEIEENLSAFMVKELFGVNID